MISDFAIQPEGSFIHFQTDSKYFVLWFEKAGRRYKYGYNTSKSRVVLDGVSETTLDVAEISDEDRQFIEAQLSSEVSFEDVLQKFIYSIAYSGTVETHSPDIWMLLHSTFD